MGELSQKLSKQSVEYTHRNDLLCPLTCPLRRLRHQSFVIELLLRFSSNRQVYSLYKTLNAGESFFDYQVTPHSFPRSKGCVSRETEIPFRGDMTK